MHLQMEVSKSFDELRPNAVGIRLDATRHARNSRAFGPAVLKVAVQILKAGGASGSTTVGSVDEPTAGINSRKPERQNRSKIAWTGCG
jgi:hypothetical protein